MDFGYGTYLNNSFYLLDSLGYLIYISADHAISTGDTMA
jgi:hypothetical protein